nr:GTP pyrophosphokinase family protein [Anaerotignum lactatifermentans]
MIEKEMQFRFKDIFEMEHPEIILKRAQPFIELMMEYQCALMEVETKLNVLNEEFASKYKRNPFESIKSRIKEPLSIINKMKRKGFEMSVESMEKNLFDIAGIRVICSFCDDIYTIAELLTRQDDIILVETKDYIKNPKANGYRSLHLILDIPIFLSTGKKHMKVEVQFRTIAMDFWASLEHKLKYKKDIEHSEEIAEELKDCADVIATMDCKMQEIRNKIEGNL